MKKLIAFSIALMLTLTALPASADHNSSQSRKKLAESLQRQATYLPRRYQTANVVDIDITTGVRRGAAWLLRSKNGLDGRIMANVPTAGDPYTLWIVVFSNPEKCAGPVCGDPDIANPATRPSVFNGSGAISADNGKDGGVVNMDFNVVAKNLPNDWFVLVGEGDGMRRNKGFRSQVALIIDQHPPIEQNSDSWINDLTTTNFPNPDGPAFSTSIAIFAPCPDWSCPDSIL